jgi:hypothetical protein
MPHHRRRGGRGRSPPPAGGPGASSRWSSSHPRASTAASSFRGGTTSPSISERRIRMRVAPSTRGEPGEAPIRGTQGLQLRPGVLRRAERKAVSSRSPGAFSRRSPIPMDGLEEPAQGPGPGRKGPGLPELPEEEGQAIRPRRSSPAPGPVLGGPGKGAGTQLPLGGRPVDRDRGPGASPRERTPRPGATPPGPGAGAREARAETSSSSRNRATASRRRKGRVRDPGAARRDPGGGPPAPPGPEQEGGEVRIRHPHHHLLGGPASSQVGHLPGQALRLIRGSPLHERRARARGTSRLHQAWGRIVPSGWKPMASSGRGMDEDRTGPSTPASISRTTPGSSGTATSQRGPAPGRSPRPSAPVGPPPGPSTPGSPGGGGPPCTSSSASQRGPSSKRGLRANTWATSWKPIPSAASSRWSPSTRRPRASHREGPPLAGGRAVRRRRR